MDRKIYRNSAVVEAPDSFLNSLIFFVQDYLFVIYAVLKSHVISGLGGRLLEVQGIRVSAAVFPAEIKNKFLVCLGLKKRITLLGNLEFHCSRLYEICLRNETLKYALTEVNQPNSGQLQSFSPIFLEV